MTTKHLIRTCLVFLLISFLLSACWNRRELNVLGIVAGIGFDIKNNDIVVSAQVIEPGEVTTQQGGTGGRAPVVLYSGKGRSIFEAFRKMTSITPRKLNFGHIRIVVISEALARKGIEDTLDFLLRDHEVRSDFYVIIAKNNKAKDVLSTFTSLDKIPAYKLYQSLRTSQQVWSTTSDLYLDEIIDAINSKGNNAALSGIEITGDVMKGESKGNIEQIDPPVRLKFESLAAFKRYKLVGWLNEEESKGYNYIHKKVINTVSAVSCPDKGNVTVEIIRTSTKLSVKVVNRKPEVHVRVVVEGNIGEVDCSLNFNKANAIYETERRLQKSIKKSIVLSVNESQKKLKTDIMGFGELIHRKEPKVWKELEDHWDEAYVNLPVHVKVHSTIRRTGKVSQSLVGRKKGEQ